MKKQIIKISITFICIFSLFSAFFASAKVPAMYYPNYKIHNSWENILDLFAQIESYVDLGEEIPNSIFSNFYDNFTKVRNYLPEKPDYNVIYNKCEILSKKLSQQYNSSKIMSFKHQCFEPLNNIIKEINKNYSVKASIKASPKSGAAPLTVTFDARGSNDVSNDTIPSDNFFWYYKDYNGNNRIIGRGPVVNHTFTQPGNYVVHLTVRSVNFDEKGIFDGEKTVSVNVGPKSAILSVYANSKKLRQDYAVKIGTETAESGVIFDGAGTHPTGGRKIESHIWAIKGPENFFFERERDDNPGSIRLSLPHKGRYTVILEIEDNEGNNIIEEYPLIVSDPVAVIKHNPEEGNTSNVFNFNASTSYSVESSIKSYKWTIFDPNGNKIENFEGKSFQKKFSTPGNYSVKLNVVDSLGNKNQSQVKIYVESTPPKAQFKINPVAKREKPSQFILDAGLSYDNDAIGGGDSLEYEWSFSNNDLVDVDYESSDGRKVMVSFDEKGTFQTKLKVTDSYGKITEKTREIKVESSLRPRILINPLATQIDNNIIFAVDSNKKIMSYDWDFGDGVTKQTQSKKVKHSYSTAGVFNVVLKVTTQSGETNEVSKQVFIGEKGFPIASYKVENNQNILSPSAKCLEKSGNEIIKHDAYLVNRYESFTIDSSDSRNVKGEKSNIDSFFEPKNGEIKNDKKIDYKFSEIGCQYIDLTVEDTKARKNDTSRIRFKVQNALPTLKDIEISFPQYGNEVGVGFRREKKEDPFKADYDPLIIRVSSKGATDPDGHISHFIWYYYKKENPEKLLEVKTTPSNINNTSFAVPRRPGNFVFGVKMVDNNGGEIKSEKIIGSGPSVFFPPSSKNPDIPIVSLNVSPISTDVGEKVRFEVDSKILSSKDDFVENRYIKYDFDGDGIYDLTTKKSTIDYRYKTPGEYKPKVKVVYRGYAGLDYGEVVDVKKGLKVNYLYDSFGKKVIFRDSSYGDIEKRDFCMNLRKCTKDKSFVKKNKDYFVFDYEKGGEYYTSLMVKDKYGNKELKRKKIKLEELTKEEKKEKINILSIPKFQEVDDRKEIEVGTTLNNSPLFYITYNGTGDCYVDSDISVDSDGDGNPEKDKNFACNKLQLQAYNPKFSSTLMRIYYGKKGEFITEDININFLDVDMNLSKEEKEIYEKITIVLNSLEVGDDKDLSYLKTLLLNLRNGIGDTTEVDSLIIQIKDWMDRNSGSLGDNMKESIDEILDILSDEAVRGALTDNKYEMAKSDILIFVPSKIKPEVKNLFSQIESANGKKNKIKESLQNILELSYEQQEKGSLDTTDLNVIKKAVCDILDYYSIPSEVCGKSEKQETIENVDEGGSLIGSIIKIILIILGISVLFFVVLIVIFAIKAKKQKNQDNEGEEEAV